ncbi:putative transcription factor & chromatin remodeling ARID-HMG family [Helianthus annuus]|nr:putative transcription factor & chromatin remodeling ARID-HMG family [Helianthus annuus]KAJ0608664.1 putative transcription factor & chromatin remodeling ARID family [Helianthus annuus]KAJ0936452.1 putative transcription factor & chromatin remodeling ARID-HMG family [Helianthus annuus]
MSAPHLSYGPKTAVFTNGYGSSTTTYPSPEASYEEIIQNPQFFWEKLQLFHSVFGTKFKIPVIGGSSLDLHRLFIEVTSRGGIEKIVSDRRWKEVMAVFKFGPTITNASFVLRKYYLSLLYHFEQVYYFHKKTPTIGPHDATNKVSRGSVSGSVKNLFSARQKIEVGGEVTGTIDNRFDQGYLVTVDLGSEKLSGFLYHLPSDSPAPSHGTHNMYQLAIREPSPEPDTSGYDVFFTEHYIRLKPLYHGQESIIRKRIQVLWSTLTEEEKQIYQLQGLRGKER